MYVFMYVFMYVCMRERERVCVCELAFVIESTYACDICVYVVCVGMHEAVWFKLSHLLYVVVFVVLVCVLEGETDRAEKEKNKRRRRRKRRKERRKRRRERRRREKCSRRR